MDDGAVSDSVDSFVNDKQRYKEPFAWDHWLSKPILNFDVKARRVEDTVDRIFKPAAVNVEQLLGCNYLDIGHEKDQVELRLGDSAGNVAARESCRVRHSINSLDGPMTGKTCEVCRQASASAAAPIAA